MRACGGQRQPQKQPQPQPQQQQQNQQQRQPQLQLQKQEPRHGMAIYHLNAKVGSRSSGQSAAAKFAYICRDGKYVETKKTVKEKNELVYSASGNMPRWTEQEPALYWMAADANERANGRLFQSVEIALPIELTEPQRIALAEEFARQLAATKDGILPYTLAVHRGKGENPHAHIMVSERINDGHARSPETWFKRAAVDKPAELGGARKATAYQPKDWLDQVRASWADQANEALACAGIKAEIDHRSHADQGLAAVPTVHEGPNVRAMADRGEPVERVTLNREIRVANFELATQRAELRLVQSTIAGLMEKGRELAKQAAEASKRIALGLEAWVVRALIRAEHPTDLAAQGRALHGIFENKPARVMGDRVVLDYSDNLKTFYASLDPADRPAFEQRLPQLKQEEAKRAPRAAVYRPAMQLSGERIRVSLSSSQADALIQAEFPADLTAQGRALHGIFEGSNTRILKGRVKIGYSDNLKTFYASLDSADKAPLENYLTELMPRKEQQRQAVRKPKKDRGHDFEID